MKAFQVRHFTAAFSLPSLLLLLLLASAARAQTPAQLQPTEPAKPAPRIALVLGGGGARGAAHIGVLEILERERIPLACVVGTSMGGLVAGGYAAGLTPALMREKLDKADWADMFLDSADYSRLSYRKKRVTKRFLSGAELGLTERGWQLQPGVIAGTKIKLFFNALVGADYGERNIEAMPIPLAIVATDIGTGEKFVFDKGSLPLAMRASMSVPGLMTPVDYQGHKLVDGGLVDNLPIDVARQLCNPDIIIAVNVGSKLKPAEQVGSLLSVSSQMIGILGKQNVAYSVASLTPADILLTPELGDFSAANFENYQLAADLGKRSAELQLEKFQAYSVDEQTYAAWRQSKAMPAQTPVTIDSISISPVQRQAPEYIAQHIRQPLGQALNRTQLEQDLIHLYGDGFYENVDYRIERGEQNTALHINASESQWSSDYLTLGFDINNEYQQGTNFDLRAAYRSTWLNRYGGEIFATGDVGSSPGFDVEFYQPLNLSQTYFIQPSLYRKREVFTVFDNDEKIAEYKLQRSYSELALGTALDIYGQSKLGWREYNIKSTSEVSEIDLGDYQQKYGGLVFEANLDRRNRLHFPSRGWSGSINYFDSQQANYGKLSTELNVAYPFNNFVIASRSAYVRATHGVLPTTNAAYLGGFLNLSAFATNQIIADSTLYTHVRGERIIGRMPLGLNGDMRFGIGLEGAKLQNAYTVDAKHDLLHSAVVYLGGETPLGPAYLGLGFTDDGKINFYMQVGAH